MSDEAKNVEKNVAESAEALPESELEKVAGGRLYQMVSTGKHLPEVTIDAPPPPPPTK